MKVIFTGDPIELANGQGLSRLTTQLFGVTFPMQAEVDVSHLTEQQKRKLLNNSHFRPAGVDAPAAPLVIPASAAAPVAADAGDEGGTEEAQAEPAAAKRKKA